MTLANARVLRFSPQGLSDTLDETDNFPGSCQTLQNLVPDQSTKNIWTCRPSAQLLTSFAGFNAPRQISHINVVGTWVYGLIATSRFPGYDEPFAFNLLNNTFAVVAGVVATNVPATQPTTGDWVPPTSDLIGSLLVVTHPGFTGANGNFFGWFDITNPANPRWHAGNLYSNGTITLLGAIVPGTLYTTGSYKNVPLTGGTGTGATADITTLGGQVTSVVLDNAGVGYTIADSLSATAASIGGTGSGFTVAVSLVATTVAGRITFTTPPAWVRQFNGRAYFGINPVNGQPSVIFTDVLVLGLSNANQALTFGDNTPLTGAAPLGLSNQLGGIIQALMIFKDASNVVQVTGDYSGSTLAINTLNVAIGTISPGSLTSTPDGIFFLAPDGFRLIDQNAHIDPPIGLAGDGVILPFIFSTSPTRTSAVSNGGIVNISLVTSGVAWANYWYDLNRKVWSGSHTFPAVACDVYQAGFIIAPQSAPGTLYLQSPFPRTGDNYVETGIPMTWNLTTSVLEDNQQMAESEICEFQIKTAWTAGVTQMTVTAQDQDGNPLNSQVYMFSSPIGSEWGSMIWGQGTWGSGVQSLAARRIDFPTPTVYNRLAIQISGACGPGFRIGDMYLRARTLGYLQVVP